MIERSFFLPSTNPGETIPGQLTREGRPPRARKVPKKAYLELLDQPAIIIPYTPKEDIANIYKCRPMALFQKKILVYGKRNYND